MVFRLYKTRIKCLCRDYDTLFWSFGFPVLLAMFFYMGFNNLGSGESIKTIPVAVVTESGASGEFVDALKTARLTDNRNLFTVRTENLETSKAMLQNNKIAGYIVFSDTPVLYIKNNGIEQSILKACVDNYLRISRTAKNILSLYPGVGNNKFLKNLTDYKNYVTDEGARDRNPNYTLIYFYTLIGLACMFGTNWGFREMVDIQANQSAVGARINVSPIHKMKLLSCNLLAAFTLHFLSLLFLLIFLNKILGIDFGDRIGMILLTCAAGSLCGISLGAMVCVVVKANIKVRGAILNVIILGGGFLSGMIIVDIKYVIATKAPVVGYLNPSSLITDAFYCLYYYDGYGKVFQNIFMLCVLTVIFWVITYFEVRRREYASI